MNVARKGALNEWLHAVDLVLMSETIEGVDLNLIATRGEFVHPHLLIILPDFNHFVSIRLFMPERGTIDAVLISRKLQEEYHANEKSWTWR